MNKLKIDIGCGSRKKEGTIGIDIQEQPGVDYVLNLQTEPLPFPNQSVEYVHSSHCLEHIENANYVVRLFEEITRVCVEGAELEFWTPYGWSNEAFIFGHNIFLNEEHYLHLCGFYSDFWEKELNAQWLLKEITYIIAPDVLIQLYKNKTDLDFALKYYKGIVKEFGVFIEVRRECKEANLHFRKTFAVDRSSHRYSVLNSEVEWSQIDLENAFKWFSSKEPDQLQSQLQEMEQLQFQRQEMEQLQSQLQEMEQLQSQLQEMEQLQSQLQEMEQLQSQLQSTQTQLQEAQSLIIAMQTSKFWKLRTKWFKFKRSIGLKD